MTTETHNYTVQLPFSKETTKSGNATLGEFKSVLTRLANSNAPNTIKSHFRKNTILPNADNGDTLYLLAKGTFNGEHYTCFATSGDKYNDENYVIEVTDEEYDMYKQTEDVK